MVGALAGKGENLPSVLLECLSLTTCWNFVCWRRHQPEQVHERELTRYIELRAAAPLPEQLHRHVHALAAEYGVLWTRLRRSRAGGKASDA